MKKRYLILAGLLVMTVAAAGCGKKKTTETAPVEVTATPTPEVTKAVDMVDMQQTADEDIKNVMGEKTSTASKIVFVNNTGDDIQSLMWMKTVRIMMQMRMQMRMEDGEMILSMECLL